MTKAKNTWSFTETCLGGPNNGVIGLDNSDLKHLFVFNRIVLDRITNEILWQNHVFI